MKKFLALVFLFLIFTGCAYAKRKKPPKVLPEDVLAPAIQFNLKDYKDYFKKTTDLKLNLKSKSDYKITCDSDIIGVNWGDVENVKMFDYKDEETGENDLRTLIVKLKYETYTYVRLYKETGEIVNILLTVNPTVEAEKKTNLGLCEVEPWRE